MAMKPSLFSQLAKSAAQPNPYKKAAKYGMVPGNIGEQTEQVKLRRDRRVSDIMDAAEDRQGELFDDYESAMENSYDDYIESQIEALRDVLEDERPGDWKQLAIENGVDSESYVPTAFTPEDFTAESADNYIDMSEYNKLQERIDNAYNTKISYPRARRRTPNFQNWNKALRIQKENQDFGHKLARLKAMGDAGKVVPMNGNPVVGGEGKAFTLNQIIAGLKKQGYSDTEIKDYILRTKVQQ